MKGKHLIRSHAMRESTSPPRTPTPRASEFLSQLSPNGFQQQHMDGNESNLYNNSNNKLHTQSSSARGNSPIIETPTVIVTSQHKLQQQPSVALCNETEFPKLSPPKSKSGNNNNCGIGCGSGINIGCITNPQRISNLTESHNTNNAHPSNKKANGDSVGGNEIKSKSNNSEDTNIENTNKSCNQSQQQQLSAGNALQKALNVSDNSQSVTIFNSPMNYQLHPNDISREQQQPQQSFIAYDKEVRFPRNDSQNSMNSNEETQYESQQHQSQQHHQRSSGGGGKKHRTNSNSKGSKPRLKNITSNSGVSGSTSNVCAGGGVASGGIASGSIDGSLNSSNNTSGFISRVFTNSENSNDQYTDHGGTDLLSFFKETLNKNVKDRQFLLKIEKDLVEFVQEANRCEIRFPQASSYNRMLIHRTAAFFGMEHNVDTETQQCVIVAPTKNTRIPEIRFKTLVITNRDDSRKSILKRDTHSFDEARQSSYLCPDRGGMLDRKAKSFEEREEDYDRARSRIFNRSQNNTFVSGGGISDDDNNYVSWTSSVDQQQFSRIRNGKALKNQNSSDNRTSAVKSNNNFGNYGAPSQGTQHLRGDLVNSNKSVGANNGNGNRMFSKQDSTGNSNTSWRLSPSSSGAVYHNDTPNMNLSQTMGTCSNASTNVTNIYQSNQCSAPQQQMNNPVNKQHKTHQMHQIQHFNKVESDTAATPHSGSEAVVESSTQTNNDIEEVISSTHLLDITYQSDDICNQDENEECDISVNDCTSITATSTKNYDRIEVQKFKNQATSPNIPVTENDEVKRENSMNSASLQSSQSQPQLQTQNRDTPHSSRSTPFSNSDSLAKRSSDESRTSWTQSYQAVDGSAVFQTTSAHNNSSTNSFCTTAYQQAPDGSIYAVPPGMIYAYPQPVEGEIQGYFMPVFDPSQQRNDTTSLLQAGTQALYQPSGAATMVPVAAYPTTQFTTTNGASIYPSQVLYSGEPFPTASTPLAQTAQAPAAAQLHQIPITSYPIGYPYPYNGYWGQTMTYYVPQQAVSATSILAAPASAAGNLNHVAGGAGSNIGHSAAGPPINSANAVINSTGHIGNINAAQPTPQNSHIATGYQAHVHGVGGGVSSSQSGGTTYYGTGRIKRPAPSHFSGALPNSSHQVITAATIPNSVTTATYQLGHAVPTLTLAAAAAPQAATAPMDITGNSGGATTVYALPQHATIFPASMYPYTTNAAAQSMLPQSAGANVGSQTSMIQQPTNPQSHISVSVSGQTGSSSGTIHNHHHSNTVITPLYTATHHQASNQGVQPSNSTIHAPGPSAIPIVDPATIANVTQLAPTQNTATYNGRTGIAANTAGASQSAPSTPNSMPTSSNIYLTQRNSAVFSTPPILSNIGSNFSTTQYYGNTDSLTAGGNNSPHNSYILSSYDKRNSTYCSSGKKPISFQSASLSRQNSTSSGGFNGSNKSSAHLINANNNDTRASPNSSTNSRPHSIKRGGGNDKPQTPLLSGPPSFVGSGNSQITNNNSYQSITNSEVGPGVIPIVNLSKPPIRLNAAAAAFRQRGPTFTSGINSTIEYRRSTASQRDSPLTNASSNENSNNNSPNSINNSSNAATPIAAGSFTPSYMISAQNNCGEATPTLPTSLFITSAPPRGPAHIPPHIQHAVANGPAIPTATTVNVSQPTVLTGAAAAADVANAAAAAAAAATVPHHHHQPLLSTYNPAASGLYFKYGHTYFAHPSVAIHNSRRSPSADLRPPIAQMAGMYPTVNMMIPAHPRHPGRHPNPNYKGTRPR